MTDQINTPLIDGDTDFNDLVPQAGINVDDDDDDLLPESMQQDVDGTGTGGTENEEGENTEPPLLAGKFKSAEDLEHAYKELQAEFTRRNQQVKADPVETAQLPEPTIPGESYEQKFSRLQTEYNERYHELRAENWDEETAASMAWQQVQADDEKIQRRVNAAIKQMAPQLFQSLGVDLIGKEISSLVEVDQRINPEMMKKELNTLGIDDSGWNNIDAGTKKQLATIAHRMALASYFENISASKPKTPDVAPTSITGGTTAPASKSTPVTNEVMAYARELMSYTGMSEEAAIKSITKNMQKK